MRSERVQTDNRERWNRKTTTAGGVCKMSFIQDAHVFLEPQAAAAAHWPSLQLSSPPLSSLSSSWILMPLLHKCEEGGGDLKEGRVTSSSRHISYFFISKLLGAAALAVAVFSAATKGCGKNFTSGAKNNNVKFIWKATASKDAVRWRSTVYLRILIKIFSDPSWPSGKKHCHPGKDRTRW